MSHLELAKKRSKFKRKALIVGIDKYQLSGADLSGCVNDARDIANTLLVLGFPSTRLKILTNEKATKANIVKGLDWLVQDAKEGDVLFYFHSGHGSQKTDVDGDEADRLDEMVIPHDFNWRDSSTHLTDDDFYNHLTGKTPQGVRCEVVFDTCYSGTGTRSTAFVFDSEMRRKRARYLKPPLEQLIRLNTMIPAATSRTKIGGSGGVGGGINNTKDSKAKPAQHNTLWSACQEDQVAWELSIGGQVRGAFTYNFCQILRRSNGNISRRRLYQILRTGMANEGYEQIPDLQVASEQAYDQYLVRRQFEDDASEIPEEQ